MTSLRSGIQVILWWMLIAVVVSLMNAHAADDATPAKQPVPEGVRTRAIILFQKVQFRDAEFRHVQEAVCTATPQCADARAKLNAAIGAYNEAVPQMLKDSGLPAGMVLDIDTEKSTVTAIPDPNAAPNAAKPAPAAAKK